jgi:hypothetical protein
MLRIDHYHHVVGCNDGAISTLRDLIMATQVQLAADIAAVGQQVAKIGEETRALIERIGALTEIIETGGDVSADVQTAMDALRAQVAVVDALVPDA